MDDADTAPEMRPYVLGPDEGARSRNPTSEIVFKLRGAQSGGATNVFEIEVGPGLGPPLHYHETQEEWLYVLEGEFRFCVEGEVTAAPAGTFVFLPRRSPHAWQSIGERPGRLIGAFVPPALERFFERFSTVDSNEATVELFAEIANDDGMIVGGPPLAQAHPL